MVKYTRLTFFEREEVSRQLASNASIRSISNKLKRSPSTISREINRCIRNLNVPRHLLVTKKQHFQQYYYLYKKCKPMNFDLLKVFPLNNNNTTPHHKISLYDIRFY